MQTRDLTRGGCGVEGVRRDLARLGDRFGRTHQVARAVARHAVRLRERVRGDGALGREAAQ